MKKWMNEHCKFVCNVRISNVFWCFEERKLLIPYSQEIPFQYVKFSRYLSGYVLDSCNGGRSLYD